MIGMDQGSITALFVQMPFAALHDGCQLRDEVDYDAAARMRCIHREAAVFDLGTEHCRE